MIPRWMRSKRRAWYRILIGVAFLTVVLVPILFGAGITWQALQAAGALVGAIVAIERAGASDDAAAKAERARESAQNASKAAHLALAFYARPYAYAVVEWERRTWEGRNQWVLLPQSQTEVSEVAAEWHFSDGRPPVKASFKELKPKDVLGRPDPELVIPLGIDADVPLTQLHTQVVWGRLDYTDKAELAVWQSTWRFKAPQNEQITELEKRPHAEFESGLVRLLDFPEDL